MQEVNAAIITIGDELLIGQTIDTNSAFIAQELNKAGIWVKRRLAIGDVKGQILTALAEQSRDCQVIIITGGLGPTADDITKPTLCEYFGAGLKVDEAVLEHVKDIFAKLNRPFIDRNLKQAEVPDNCTVLFNYRGTAPGMWFEKDGVIYVSLPGVPNEMKGLMQTGVMPKLTQTLALPVVLHRTALVAGIGESFLADLLSDFEEALPPAIKLAYLPAYGTLRLRLTGKGDNKERLEEELARQFKSLQGVVQEWLVAEEDISLAEAIVRLLKTKGKTLATAESCTGGYVAHAITSISGSSAVYNGSVVSYANEVKETVLGVAPQLIQTVGAVSEEVVTGMAKGVLQAISADYAIATSGIMGPGGGTPEKPAGTVWIAVGNGQQVKAAKHFLRFDRERNIEQTAQLVFMMLRRFILETEATA